MSRWKPLIRATDGMGRWTYTLPLPLALYPPIPNPLRTFHTPAPPYFTYPCHPHTPASSHVYQYRPRPPSLHRLASFHPPSLLPLMDCLKPDMTNRYENKNLIRRPGATRPLTFVQYVSRRETREKKHVWFWIYMRLLDFFSLRQREYAELYIKKIINILSLICIKTAWLYRRHIKDKKHEH